MLQTVAFTGARTVAVRATFVHYRDATIDAADQGVELFVQGVPYGVLQPGDSIEMPFEADTFELVPKTVDMAGTFLFGLVNVRPGDTRSTVQVDSGWRDTLSDRQATIDLSATGIQGVLLAAVTKPATLRSIRVVVTADAFVEMRPCTGTPTAFFIALTPQNCRMAASYAGNAVRMHALSANTGLTLRLTAQRNVPVQANREIEMINGAPFYLNEGVGGAHGQSLLFTATAGQIYVYASFEYPKGR